jgi:hypothetical protein
VASTGLRFSWLPSRLRPAAAGAALIAENGSFLLKKPPPDNSRLEVNIGLAGVRQREAFSRVSRGSTFISPQSCLTDRLIISPRVDSWGLNSLVSRD